MTPQGPAIFVSIRIRFSDDGADTKLFCGGDFTTDFLSWLVRDEQKIALEEARYRLPTLPVHAARSAPAATARSSSTAR